MANNKVQLANGTVLIDLTDTTATASDVASGSYFYDAAGVKQSGTLVVDETYSVSKTLTNVSSSNDDSKVIAGNSFYADLTPTSGYAITSITVTMGGVDVTEQVFQPGMGSKAITANGTYNASNDSLSGYDRVVVNVPTGGGEPSLQSKSVTVTPSTSTQTQTVSPDAGYDGLSSVGVTVNPIPSEYIIPSGSQTFTDNGVYDVSSLASAVVSVSGSGSAPLYPLGTSFVSNDWLISCGNGHIRLQARRAISSAQFIGLRWIGVGTSVINNLPTWFTISSGSSVSVVISNVTNESGLTWNANMRKASASTSLSYGIGDGTHVSGEAKTFTATANDNVGAYFLYIQATIPSGAVLEFDLSVTVDGVRYY